MRTGARNGLKLRGTKAGNHKCGPRLGRSKDRASAGLVLVGPAKPVLRFFGHLDHLLVGGGADTAQDECSSTREPLVLVPSKDNAGETVNPQPSAYDLKR